MAQIHTECPSCTCGKVAVEWSDRGPCYIDPNDSEEVVEITLNCVLDHSYDRTNDGVPYGMPDKLRGRLGPAIFSWLNPRFPKWQEETIYGMEDSQREEFKQHLLAALRT